MSAQGSSVSGIPSQTARPLRWVVPTVHVLLAVLALVALQASAPPAAQGAHAPRDQFSAARAERHLEWIAQRPHPSGSQNNARVRDHLVSTARSLGAEVTVESDDLVRPELGNPFAAGTVHNVVAKVPGSAPRTSDRKALLLVSHYDSVPTGPGAADDGAAVAAMLETMRALKASGGVRNDVVFLFTDGEEVGSLGAEAYVRRHGVDRYGAVLNWEARGSRGPVVMFETSTGNGPLIDAFADTGTRPVANSLAYEVYKRMPNGSDFTVFRDAGAAGLNSAFLDGFHDYHSVRDSTGRLSADSVQHHGETMLGTVRALGGSDLRTVRPRPGGDGSEGGAGDSVYFDLFARVLVHYPAGWALPLALSTVLGTAGLLVLGVRRKTLRVSGVLMTTGVGLAATIAAALLSALLWYAAPMLRPGLAALPQSEPYEQGLFAAGFLVLAGAALLTAAHVLRGRRPAELTGGVLLLGAVLLLATTLTVPGAGYLFQWPLLAGLPALWWLCRNAGDARPGWPWVSAAAAAPAVAVVLFAPLVDNLLTALGIPLAAVAVAVAALGGALLLPLLVRLPRPGLLGAAAAGLALVLLGAGFVRSDFAPSAPRPNALVYVQHAKQGSDGAEWLGDGTVPDAWTRKVLGDDPEQATAPAYFPGAEGRKLLRSKAPGLNLPSPKVRLTDDSTGKGIRSVRFTVESQRDAWHLEVRLPRRSLRSCTVAGERINSRRLAEGSSDGDAVFVYTGAEKPVEFDCRIAAGKKLAVHVADLEPGLPSSARKHIGPRPDDTVPTSFGFGLFDSSVVRANSTL